MTATAPSPVTPTTAPAAPATARALGSLEHTLVSFGRFRKLWRILHGLGKTVLWGPGALLAWFLLDWAARLPAWPLLISFALVGLLALLAFLLFFLPPLFRRIRPEREALLIENLHGQLDNQLIGSLQLGREIAAAPASLPHSPHFVHALLAHTAERLTSLKPQRLLNLRPAKRILTAAAAVVLTIVLCLTLARAAVDERIARLTDAYAAVLDSLFPIDLRVSPGDVALVRGKPVTLSVTVQGARRHGVTLVRTDLKTRHSVSEPLTLQNLAAATTLTPAESFTYRFEYANRRSAEHTVLVGDLPDLAAINFELTYPNYTAQPPRTLSGRLPKLQALAGTTVLVSFAATTDLSPEGCYVQWTLDGTRQAIPITGRFGHFPFAITRGDRATVTLTGALGPDFKMPSPVTFEIAVQPDEPPTARIAIKKRDLVMFADEAAKLALPYTAEDDFGIAEVNLEYVIEPYDPGLPRPTRRSTLPRRIDPPQDRAKGVFTEIFKGVAPPIEAGDRITLILTARDNNTETGPSASAQDTLTITVVRPDLAGFREFEAGFASAGLLGGLKKLTRNTDLLIEPEKTSRTEKPQTVEKTAVKARVNQESWPSGSEDAVGSYFQLLSGQNTKP